MHTHRQDNSKGFTLIETLIAILILTLSIGALLSLAAGGFYSVRYSRNQIAANALMQESIEYIRNTRDTAFQQGLSWDTWQTLFEVNENGAVVGGNSGCFAPTGCIVDPYASSANVLACPTTGGCPKVRYFADQFFYGYKGPYPFSIVNQPYETSFIRTITMSHPSSGDANQVMVNVVISWQNGLNTKTISQSVLITNWKL